MLQRPGSRMYQTNDARHNVGYACEVRWTVAPASETGRDCNSVAVRVAWEGAAVERRRAAVTESSLGAHRLGVLLHSTMSIRCHWAQRGTRRTTLHRSTARN
jgi:hypothetical protein